MGQFKRMDQIRYILETYRETRSMKGTARRLQVSRNTIYDYLGRAWEHCEEILQVLELSESEFLEVMYPKEKDESASREVDFVKQIGYWITQLPRVGVTKKLLWEEYRKQHETGFGYSQICKRLSREIDRRDLK